MKKMGNIARRILYRLLPLRSYLRLLSRFYFTSFNLGLLKNHPNYQYPYFLKELIAPGDVCIDIGANLGYYSRLISKLIGPTGKLYSVEPVEPILDVLRKNTHGLTNMEILPYALGIENKEISIGNNTVRQSGFMASGSHSVMESNEEADVVFKAEMKIGSELFKDLNRLDFIKCDIEGYEGVVLTELQNLIFQHMPIVLIETKGDIRKNLISLFNKEGYNSFVLKEGKLISTDYDQKTDMLMIPEDKIAKYRVFMS